MNGLPISYYNLRKVFFFLKIIFVLSFFVFIGGNLYVALTKHANEVASSATYKKNGFLLFSDGKEYIRILKEYRKNPGVQLKFHTMKNGESFWDIANANRITVETLLAANPFLTSLLAEENLEIVIPAKNGVLLPCAHFTDAIKMKKLLGIEPTGDYYHNIFELFSLDDVRFAFYPEARPALVNNYIEGLYNIKHSFDTPIIGPFASFFGMRIDPFIHSYAFHTGLDISGMIGTKIHPIQDGIVSFAGWRDGYGNCMTIIHRDGYISLYGHCELLIAKVGDFVTKKDTIALVGNTGRSTGPHVHLEIERHGKLYNPLFFIW